MNINLLNAIAKAYDEGNGVKSEEPFIKKPVEQPQPPEMVTISWERYKELCECENFLHALQACGVDNWSGYSDALALLDEEEGGEG